MKKTEGYFGRDARRGCTAIRRSPWRTRVRFARRAGGRLFLRRAGNAGRRPRLHSGGRRTGRRGGGLRADALRAGCRGDLRVRRRCGRGAGRHGRGILRPSEPRAEAGGRHRHERQDDDRHAALRPGAGAGLPRGADLDGGLSDRRPRNRGDAHDARPDPPERHDARDGRRRVRILLHGVLLARHRAGAHAGGSSSRAASSRI